MKKIELIHEVRAVKSKKEIKSIVKAQRISEKVLQFVLKNLKTGISELQVSNLIKNTCLSYGVSVLSFPPIVAFGKNTANIHHQPGQTKLKVGDNIMFDFGCTVNHYCSDMTRTYFWGKPSRKQIKIYEVVLAAQDKAIRKLKQGERRAWVVDKTARRFIAKKFKNNFKHGLGHGVGTVIHEWPNFKPRSNDILPVGCVMTVEPGVYLKGSCGVRIEDMVLIARNSVKNLTSVPKDINSAILKGHEEGQFFAKKYQNRNPNRRAIS